MPALRTTAFVERRHRLVRRTDLYLHEKSSLVRTFRTIRIRRVYVFPRGSTTQNVVHFFQLRVGSGTDLLGDVEDVRASVAGEAVTFGAFFDEQQIMASRTKP